MTEDTSNLADLLRTEAEASESNPDAAPKPATVITHRGQVSRGTRSG